MTDERADASPSDAGETLVDADARAIAARVPPATRMAYELPKPRNWQDFQRGCVIFYAAELNDPHATAYGRDGQEQRGIDILARRDGNPDHFVGIQCKRIAKPLTKAKIMAECRAALTVEAGLKEIIFATTAADSTRPTDDAVAVERELRAEGHAVQVAYYGWESLGVRIGMHPSATAVFNPTAYASGAVKAVVAPSVPDDLSAQLAQLSQLLASVQAQGLSLQPVDQSATDKTSEDPALHSRIDVFRDLFQKDHQLALAERSLLDLHDKTDFATRPWARFRIETNLASIAMELGREADAVTRFEAAHALQPGDANAIANLALARTIQGRFEEAMALARQALEATPRSEAAIAYLLQAAARARLDLDPESLVPADLQDHVAAAFGVAEYLRRREAPDWPERSIALAARHPESDELKRIAALAVLERAVREQAFLGTTGGHVTSDQIRTAAEDAQAMAERYLANGYTHDHDLVAWVTNASVLLRMAGRDREAETLLRGGLKVVPQDELMIRLLAMCEVSQGRRLDAIATLASAGDTESCLFRAELMKFEDRQASLESALALDVAPEDTRLTILRWRMIGEIALELGRTDVIAAAVAGLRASDGDPLAPALLDIRATLGAPSGIAAGTDVSDRTRPLLDLAERVTDATEPLFRVELAETLLHWNEPDAAADLLAGRIDFSRPTAPAMLYLQALAAARRDVDFETSLQLAAPALRDDPSILWTRAARAWNMGDLTAALTAVDALIALQPDNSGGHLLRIDILARADRTSDLLGALAKPLERLGWRRFEDQARLAGLLARFGQLDRAIALAYRLFLERRDEPRGWLGLSGIVIEQGRSLEDDRWHVVSVRDDSAVDIEFAGGDRLFLVVEPDQSLRRVDQDAYPADHPLVAVIRGLATGDAFEAPDGRTGTIAQLRHKYVARFHYVLEHFETRFPDVGGFRRIVIQDDSSDAVEKILDQAQARSEWVEQEQQTYTGGIWPISLLAMRLGADVIEVASGLAAQGQLIKVASGATADVDAAIREIEAHHRHGCTLDLLTFWTAWRIGALGALQAAYGNIHITQSVVDRLRTRRDRLAANLPHGLKLAQVDAGRLSIIEVPPEILLAQRDQTQAAIDWLQAHAQISPVMATPDLPEILREHVRLGRADLFDALVLSVQTDTLLICDDLFTRAFMGALTGRPGIWLQVACMGTLRQRVATGEDYVRWTAALVEAGQSFLSVDAETLAHAAEMDARQGASPGPLFRTVSTLVGGALADPASHLNATLAFLQIVWNDVRAIPYREPVTGLLLERLVRERWSDYGGFLAVLVAASRQAPDVLDFLAGWLQGHFIPVSALSAGTRRPKKPPRATRGRPQAPAR